MKNFTKDPIIVPWDFSDMAEKALETAVGLAASPSQIEVIHVTSYPSSVEPSIVWGTYSEDTIIENLHKSFQDEVGEGFREIGFTALFGDPGSEIAKFAESKKAGLVVISSHGRKGITRLLLGSVAERVVRMAPCPVLVLRESAPD